MTKSNQTHVRGHQQKISYNANEVDIEIVVKINQEKS